MAPTRLGAGSRLMPETPTLLELKGVRKQFEVPSPWLRHRHLWALNGVDMQVPQGASIGVVGESGCGKTTLARAIVHLIPITSGEICYNGVDLGRLSEAQFRPYVKRIQMVFQDPTDSLNPRMSAGRTVEEALLVNGLLSRRERKDRVADLFRQVGLTRDHMSRFPHQMSSGQRQRVGIARALTVEPELLVLDEPTSALDVSVRGRVLQLLDDLRARLGLTYVVISHDLSVIAQLCERVEVMYLGTVMEEGPIKEVLRKPMHPYTQALISAIPRRTTGSWTRRVKLEGEPPSPLQAPRGCPLVTRCPFVLPSCSEERPPLFTVSADHRSACIRLDELKATAPEDLHHLMTRSGQRSEEAADVAMQLR